MNMPEAVSDGVPGGEPPAPGQDPLLAALLGRGEGGEAVDPLALLKAQLETQAQTDPRTALILRCLEQRAQQPPAEEMEPAGEEAGADVSELQDLMEQAYSELEALRMRNDVLAAALGACYLCFGEDPLCETCGGRGVPGSRAPEPTAFRKYVLPAMRRAQAVEARRSVRAPPRERAGGPTDPTRQAASERHSIL